jgi:hypothetical protein
MVEVLYKNLLAGVGAEQVRSDIRLLCEEQRQLLFCVLSGALAELKRTCVDHAVEVGRVLAMADLWPSARPQATSTA